MAWPIIFVCVAAAATIGAVLVDDHVTQALLIMAAVVLLLAAYPRKSKKISGIWEMIRLVLWP